MLPPGLAFASVSEKAWRLADKAKNAAFYFNFKRERENQHKNQTAYTPAVSLILGLQEVMNILKAEGLEKFSPGRAVGTAMREGMQGCRTCHVSQGAPSDALTALSLRKVWMARLSIRICDSVRHDGCRWPGSLEGQDLPSFAYGLY